ncbi:MAG TPA: NUDIX domain-containing protein [Candidatus Saccharimonadales bacterium]|nr:NUDIX domain-containing protein [Candidatus Saccharimonadales bacterium]
MIPSSIQDENLEVLDLVNDQDEKIGTILRGEVVKVNYRMPGKYVRFVNGFVVNKAGQIFIQTRSPHKFIAPNGFDYSVAEHVFAGETYDAAIIRGFEEELGWQIDPKQLADLGKLPPTPEKPVFDRVYALINYEGPDPTLNTDEFTSAEWLSIEEIQEMLTAAKITQKASLIPALALLEAYLAGTTSK